MTIATKVPPVYLDLLKRYPTAAALAGANRSSLENLLTPLGLQRQRARQLIALGSALHEEFQDTVPETMEQLRSLPGVGDYTAAAVLDMCFGGVEPAVDRNVARVLGRYFKGRDLRWNHPSLPLLFGALLESAPGARALLLGTIDLSATMCRPLMPRCHLCVLCQSCRFAATRGRPSGR